MLPSGDLVVEGMREVDINGDRSVVVLSGDATAELNVVVDAIRLMRVGETLWPGSSYLAFRV